MMSLLPRLALIAVMTALASCAPFAPEQAAQRADIIEADVTVVAAPAPERASDSADAAAEVSAASPEAIDTIDAPDVAARPAAPAAIDTDATIDLTQPPADAWTRIRRGFAIPNLENKLVQKWTDYYVAHPEQMQRMTERARKYLYYVVDEINRRGLPTELALLPFIESAYNPDAYSRARAAGLWQFIPSTGQHYNLTQDWWRDERRDPVASTDAALDYLEYLFEYQGDWYLALASYNWGEGAVRRAIEQNKRKRKATDYLSLTMPAETRNYVPKLQAIKNIVADPERYGVTLPDVDNTPYFAVVNKARTIDVVLAAQFAQMPVAEFQALNPAFNRPVILAEHDPKILLPRDKVALFQANLAAHKGPLASWKTYQAKHGESLAAIAKRHGITLANLRTVNSLPAGQTTVQTTARTVGLLVPSTPQASKQLAQLRLPGPARLATRIHTVRAGDTLYDLARRYGTTVQQLRTLNNLRGNLLKIGARLRVPGAVRG